MATCHFYTPWLSFLQGPVGDPHWLLSAELAVGQGFHLGLWHKRARFDERSKRLPEILPESPMLAGR